MKKKLLLTILPTILLLSACSGIQRDFEPRKENIETFTEDTLAHEEVFGGEFGNEYKLGQPESLQPRRAFLDKRFDEVNPLEEPSIGVQYAVEDDGDYAIRYVAAITSLSVKATWTRDIAEPDGSRPRDGQQIQFVVNTAYSALSSDSGSGDSYTTPKQVDPKYNYFVVYTLRNIPSDKVESYLFGYLTLTPLEGEGSVSTQARISRLGGGNSFKIDPSNTGYFLKGTFSGEDDIISIPNDSGSEYYAKKESFSLAANDTFGMFKWGGDHFQFFGNGSYAAGSRFVQPVSYGYSKVYLDGTYSIYLCNNPMNKIKLFEDTLTTTLYLHPGVWNADGAKFAAYAFNNDRGINEWYGPFESSALDANGYLTISNFKIGKYNQVIFARINPNFTEANLRFNKISEPDWNKRPIWNQTSDQTIPAPINAGERGAWINGWNEGDCTWGIKS